MTVNQTLWVEKYRPETLDEIVGHEQSVERLQHYADDAEVPHMIFSGPPGTGKTASIVAFAREVYGDAWRKNLTEMNASDERGIDTIRHKVKDIARSSPAGDADYQILLMDEFDQMTKDAQAALRRMMEEHSDVTRFFLSCNHPNKIIEAIQSRCSLFRFNRLGDDGLSSVVSRVVEQEDLDVSDAAFDTLVTASKGDARTAINTLQSASLNGAVTEEQVENVVGVIDKELIEHIVDLAISGQTEEAMNDLDEKLLKAGASTDQMSQMFLRVIKQKDIPAPGKMKIMSKLSDCDWRVRQGANPNVQWHSFITDITVGYQLTLNNYEGRE